MWFRVGVVKATVLESGLLKAEFDPGQAFDMPNFEAYVRVMLDMYGPGGAYQLAHTRGVRVSSDVRKALMRAPTRVSGTAAAGMVTSTKIGSVFGNFLLRLAQPDFALRVCDDEETAVAFLLEQMAAHHFDPATIRAPDLAAAGAYPVLDSGGPEEAAV